MPRPDETQRLAAAINQLRPDWTASSVASFIERHHESRCYVDLAVAFVAVACDPDTRTPQRLNEAGPWWQLVQTRTSNQVGPGKEPRCEHPGHEFELARACRCCRAERIGEAS